MKRGAAGMPTSALAITAVSFTGAGSDAACARAPTLTWSEACLKACATAAEYNLCQETLARLPDHASAEATVYAAEAARSASRSYEATVALAERLLGGSGGARSRPLPGADEQAAYRYCVGSCYAVARARMAGVASDMAGCAFEHTIAEYVQAVAALEHCTEALEGFPGSPLRAMNAADREATALARDLGALIVGR